MGLGFGTVGSECWRRREWGRSHSQRCRFPEEETEALQEAEPRIPDSNSRTVLPFTKPLLESTQLLPFIFRRVKCLWMPEDNLKSHSSFRT